MTQLNEREAIADLLNQSLQPKGITAKASVKDDCLRIWLCSVRVPDPQAITALILPQITDLKLTSIQKIKICAQQEKTFDFAWQKELPIGTHVNQISNEIDAYTSNQTSEAEFREALERCSVAAKKAYQQSLDYYEQISDSVQELERSLKRTQTNQNISNDEIAKVLQELATEIKKQAGEELEELKRSINIKGQHLEEFTVVLFGRTKAGKSTIREALTKGDGSTIGKGSQRTTRDVKEYRWKGVRLIDTPGVEAYSGEEDKQKALDIVRESDMAIYLVSDDSFQPGELQSMVLLKELNKYFFVVLNVKYVEKELENTKRMIRFIKKLKNEVFNSQRLREHKQHIRSSVKNSFGIELIDIFCIHALAAFLSTQPQYTEYAQELWQLSRIEKVYQLIASEIVAKGSQRRWDTLINTVIYFLDRLIEKLEYYCTTLKKQVKNQKKKQEELKKIFRSHKKSSASKVERKCKKLFDEIREQVPQFVENHLGKDNTQFRYRCWMDKEERKIQKAMKDLFEELAKELTSTLAEFQRQYQYDTETTKINFSNLGSFQEWRFGKLLEFAGVGLGAFSAIALGLGTFSAANFWNPVGWAAGAASVAVGFFGWYISEEEEKTWRKKKQEAKEDIWKKLKQAEQKVCKHYQDLFIQQFSEKVQQSILSSLDCFISELTEVIEIINKSLERLRLIRKNASNHTSQKC